MAAVTTVMRQRVAEFLDTDYARVVGTVAAATGDRQRAEDAVQDALVKTLTGDTEPDNLSGWITVLAINFVKQAWRRADAQGRAYVKAVEWPLADGPEARIECLAVREALDELPPRERMAVTLHYMQGLSVEQTAQTLNVTAGTVKTQLSRGRAALAEQLDKEAS